MHLNPRKPNILADMKARANRARLYNPFSKRHLIPRKSYPYASERQSTRFNRKMIRLANSIDWNKERTIDLIEQEREHQSLVWDIDGH